MEEEDRQAKEGSGRKDGYVSQMEDLYHMHTFFDEAMAPRDIRGFRRRFRRISFADKLVTQGRSNHRNYQIETGIYDWKNKIAGKIRYLPSTQIPLNIAY